MDWELYQELTDQLCNEMIWANCRACALEWWMEHYYKKSKWMNEDLILWAYLNAMEQLGLETEGDIHCV